VQHCPDGAGERQVQNSNNRVGLKARKPLFAPVAFSRVLGASTQEHKIND